MSDDLERAVFIAVAEPGPDGPQVRVVKNRYGDTGIVPAHEAASLLGYLGSFASRPHPDRDGIVIDLTKRP